MDGIVCFAIEMSSATQNWLKISDGQGYMSVNGVVKYCESRLLVRLIFSRLSSLTSQPLGKMGGKLFLCIHLIEAPHTYLVSDDFVR